MIRPSLLTGSSWRLSFHDTLRVGKAELENTTPQRTTTRRSSAGCMTRPGIYTAGASPLMPIAVPMFGPQRRPVWSFLHPSGLLLLHGNECSGVPIQQKGNMAFGRLLRTCPVFPPSRSVRLRRSQADLTCLSERWSSQSAMSSIRSLSVPAVLMTLTRPGPCTWRYSIMSSTRATGPRVVV